MRKWLCSIVPKKKLERMSCTSGDHGDGEGEGTWKGCETSHFRQALTQLMGMGRK